MFVAVLFAVLLSAQSPDVRQQTLKSGVEVRTVTIWVHGKHGGLPKPVGEKDFTVFENGVHQPITLFVKNTDDPKVTRYEIGYKVKPSGPGEKKRIEVRVRGFRGKIRREFVTR